MGRADGGSNDDFEGPVDLVDISRSHDRERRAGKSMMLGARQSGILDILFVRHGGLFGRRR